MTVAGSRWRLRRHTATGSDRCRRRRRRRTGAPRRAARDGSKRDLARDGIKDLRYLYGIPLGFWPTQKRQQAAALNHPSPALANCEIENTAAL